MVCDHDLWVWHVFAGSSGSNNDIKVLKQGPFFLLSCAVVTLAALAVEMVETAVRMLGRVAPAALAGATVVVPTAAVAMVTTAMEALGMVAPATLVAEVVCLGHYADALVGPLTVSQLTLRSKSIRACFPPPVPSPTSLLGCRRRTRPSV